MHESRRGFWIIAFAVLLLIVLWYDFWLWEDSHLVFGFLPVGMFYHVCISIAAGLVWLLAAKIAWPGEQGLAHEDHCEPQACLPAPTLTGQSEESR